MTAPRRKGWRGLLDRLRLPFDWRLLAPAFWLGAAAGFGALLWFVVFVAGPMV